MPLPLVEGKNPVVATKDSLSTFSPNSFFDSNQWVQVYWKFWSDDQVSKAWANAVNETPEAFFENVNFLNKYLAAGPTVFSTNGSLKAQVLKSASEYYISNTMKKRPVKDLNLSKVFLKAPQ